MTTDAEPGTCPDVETLGALIEGRLDDRRRRDILAHLDGCADCMTAFELGAETVRDEGSRRRWSRAIPLAAAAAIVAALAAVPAMREMIAGRFQPSAMQRLVAAMPREQRTVEPRLSGGFPWAKYSSPVRTSATADTDPARLKLHGAAGEVLDRATHDASADATHAAGVALLLIDRPQEGIARLQSLAQSSPNDARIQNDLAAAYYSTALRLGRAALYPRALAAADRALELEPRMAEALFNRALILERLGLREEARRAWQQCLEADSSSAWAREARLHLERLPQHSNSSLFRESIPRLEKSDAKALRAVVDRFHQQARTWAEVELLGQWAEAERSSDAAAAALKLGVARSIGATLIASAGEHLLADAVSAIDSAEAGERVALAEAHGVYREGRLAYSRRAPSDAEPLLRRAANLFEAGRSPMAAVARYYAANTVFDQNRPREALAQLEVLQGSVPPQHVALHAQIEWELGLCHLVEGEWSRALATLGNSAARFDRLGETGNAAFVESLKAEVLASLGRPNESWQAWTAAFAKLSDHGDSERLFFAIDAAARMEIDARRYDCALAMLRVEAAHARAGRDDAQLAIALVRQVLVSEKTGRHADAEESLAEALRAEGRVSDARVRERAGADIRLAAGTVALRSDALRAKQLLGEAIRAYESSDRPILLPEAYLQRARAEAMTNDRAAARADLDRGIAELERQKSASDASSSSGIAEIGRSLYEHALLLALDDDDAASAFARAERRHGGSKSVREVQAMLAGSETAVLELVVLDSEIVAFAITAKNFAATRTPVPRARVEASAARRNDRESLASLHEWLIAPSWTAIEPARELIVVADRVLEGVPFAALRDAKSDRYLIERFTIAQAESASSLRASKPAMPASAVVATLQPREGDVALAAVREEADGVAALYPGVKRLDAPTFPAFIDAARHGAVVHLAGHADRIVANEIDPLLTFAANERVSWRTVARQPLPNTAVVVLAACETLRSSDAEPTGRSIAAGFLAAGASNVIGTLAPIEDEAAREIFLDIHRHLAAGAPAAAAVQKAQLRSLIAGGRKVGAWGDVASVTTRLTR